MKKITFVCTGNTCRSAMAEIIFKFLLKKHSVKGVRVASRGLNVRECSINPLADNSLKKLGIKVGKFIPKQINYKTCEKQDAVICMTENQKSAFNFKTNVWSINEICGLGEIFDPYGGTQEIYDETAEKLFSSCKVILNIMNEKL